MEAGKIIADGETQALDLVDAMVIATDPNARTDEEVAQHERSASDRCAAVRRRSRRTRQPFNRGGAWSVAAWQRFDPTTHADRKQLFLLMVGAAAETLQTLVRRRRRARPAACGIYRQPKPPQAAYMSLTSPWVVRPNTVPCTC